MKTLAAATILSVLVFVLASCGSGSDGEGEKRGVFLSTNSVEGVHYSCMPSKNEGTTTNEGRYTYETKDVCTFSIGKLVLGSTVGNAVVTPLSLTSAKSFEDPNAIKMSQLLLSLDKDFYSANGIQIDNTLYALFNEEISLQELDLSDVELKIGTLSPQRGIVDAETAYEYLFDTLNSIPQVEVDTKLTRVMISGKSFAFTNVNGEIHYADFREDGTYEDEIHECTPKWHIEGSTVKINSSDCPHDYGRSLSFIFYETPTEGGVVRIDEDNSSTNVIISQIKSDQSLLLSPKHWYSDKDAKHVTFVNQTGHDICIYADLRHFARDSHIVVESHEAKYLNVRREIKDNDTFYVDFDYDQNSEKCNGSRKGDSSDPYDQVYTPKFIKNRGVYYYHGKGKLHTEVDVYADLSGCDDNRSKPAILFAHGLHDTQKAWGKFARYAKEHGWRVFRTSVSANGSVMKRAHMLSDYIVKIAEKCKIDDNQLRVVGHSMGGLDLRYILSAHSSYENLKKSRNIIERAYTLATPHGGAYLADLLSFYDDGIKSCSIKAMKGFNENLPYSRIQSYNKSLLAIRFHLDKEVEDISNDNLDTLAQKELSCDSTYCYVQPNDGVVWTADMSHGAIPYAKKLYRGKHTPTNYIKKVYRMDYGNIDESVLEQHRTAVLQEILDDYRSKNIAHYNEYGKHKLK